MRGAFFLTKPLSRRALHLTVTSSSSSSTPSPSSSSSSILFLRTLITVKPIPNQLPNTTSLHSNLLDSPWSAIQQRGSKVLGIDVRVGNVVQRKGRIYQVLKAQHTQQGRGGATIQVELRDVNSGNKLNERFRTDEALEKVFVEEKFMTYLYSDGDLVVLMEPDTFEQIEVSKDLFGKAAGYLKEDMKVILQLYDERPMSASVPKRVTCTVVEAQAHMKGITATPQYKRVLLDNGLTVLVPPFISTGDAVVIDTSDDSYLTRAKE